MNSPPQRFAELHTSTEQLTAEQCGENGTMAKLKSLWTLIWKVTVFFLLWALLWAPFVILVAPRLASIDQSSALYVQLYVNGTGSLTILAAAWVMAHFADRRSFSFLGFTASHIVRDMLIGVLHGVAWLGVSLAILWLFGWATLSICT
jgi:hypothetical protein